MILLTVIMAAQSVSMCAVYPPLSADAEESREEDRQREAGRQATISHRPSAGEAPCSSRQNRK
jgi:hypothetical protein